MSIRYLLLVSGDPTRQAHIAAAITAADDLLISRPNDRVTLLTNWPLPSPAAPPVIIGDIFPAPGAAASPAASPFPPEPETLVSNHWGRYIAIWPDISDKLQLLRDPSGAIPCYYRAVPGLTVVASDLDLLERAAPTTRSLDWQEIARILGAGDLRSPQTGLQDVKELPAGDLLSIGPDGLRLSHVWSPATAACSPMILNAEEQAMQLRQCLETVFSSLCARHPTALATISGGLDSSIVALSMAPVTPHLTCLTAATADPSGDERRYARVIADAAGASYVEGFLDLAHINLLVSQTSHLPRPNGRPFMQSLSRLIAETAGNAGASAVFNGTGGDNVFCFLQSATPIADRIQSEGFLRALPTVRDMAVMAKASFGEVAVATWQRLKSAGHKYQWRGDNSFLHASFGTQTPEFRHPWLDLPDDSRLGTAIHIAMILRTQNYLDPWTPNEHFEAINPLLMQPVIECCLRIPSWSWCHAGENRAVARRAFVDQLPDTIRRRSWKGGPEGLVGRLAETNRPTIRMMLVDGELASHDLLDRQSIADILDAPQPLTSSDALRLLNLCDAEAWVRGMS